MSEYGGIEALLSFSIASSLEVRFVTDTTATRMFSSESDGLGVVSAGLTFVDVTTETFATLTIMIGSTQVEITDFNFGYLLTGDVDVRFFMANNDVAVYVNNRLIGAYTFSVVEWQDEPDLKIYAYGASCSVVSATRVELEDKREAIWIDSESSSASAINSIIQQRPVIRMAKAGRETAFTYKHGESSVTSGLVHKIIKRRVENPQACSDAMVYGSDIFLSTHPETAEAEGFVVKVYRLSELDYGQKQAAAALQDVAFEQLSPITVISRFDQRLEEGDIYAVSKIITATGRTITFNMIAENISMRITGDNVSMNVIGREI